MEKLTNSQKSIWVTEQYYKGSSINNICGSAIIEEYIDFEKLEKAVKIVCQKHDNFRLKLKFEDGEIMQVLSKEKNTEISTIEVATLKDLEEEIQKIVTTPFKIENSELYKFYIIKFENGEGGFMLNIHHLIADAWTLAFINNEIIKTYSELKQNQEIETKAIYSYIDYIKAEQEYLQSEKYQKDKSYWEGKFQIIPEVATIPGSKLNGDESNPIGNRKLFNLDKEKVEKIKQYCQANKISVYNFFMAIYAIYIGEISNLDEFVIGTPILNRTNFKEKNAAGMFINMAPFKINMANTKDFKTFVRNIALDSMGMLKHQKYSYQCLLENLREKNKGIPNLYKILLSYQITNAHQIGGDMTYTTQWTFNGCCAENMDIQIYDLNDTGSLNVAYDYKTSIYYEEDIENLHNRILNIIDQVMAKESIDLKDIEIVTPEEKEKLLIEFNKTELKYNTKETVISLFEKQVELTPEKIAIISNKQKLTYRELNEKANMLARNIIKKRCKATRYCWNNAKSFS